MCFVLYYYQVINLVISDLKTSKSLISNARPGLRVEWKCPTPGMCFSLYMKMAGRGGWAHLDLADALKVMEKKFSYCYYKMAYCAYSCAYSRLLVKYLLARSRNLL